LLTGTRLAAHRERVIAACSLAIALEMLGEPKQEVIE